MLSHFYQPCISFILTMQSRFSCHASLSSFPAFEFRPCTYAFQLFALLALAFSSFPEGLHVLFLCFIHSLSFSFISCNAHSFTHSQIFNRFLVYSLFCFSSHFFCVSFLRSTGFLFVPLRVRTITVPSSLSLKITHAKPPPDLLVADHSF